MTTDIVPTDNMAALDTLDVKAREIAVTQMLDQARSWLAHSVEATEPVRVQNFRAFVTTIAESTKQLRLSKEIRLDATEMIRRAERGLTIAIRRGQEEGKVAKGAGRPPREIADDVSNCRPPAVTDIAPDFYNNGSQIGRLGDDFTDEEFEDALTAAKEEGNLSRANVLRKGEQAQSATDAQRAKWEQVAEMAAQGYSSRQIAIEVGMSEAGLKRGAERNGITFPADKAIGHTRRVDTSRVIREATTQLEGVVMGLSLIDPGSINPEEAPAWADSLTQSIKALTKARNTIKESIS